MSRPLVHLLVECGWEPVTEGALASSSSPRELAIAAVALSSALVALRHEEGLTGESPYALAVLVVDTAYSEGVSYVHATHEPHLAVGATRRAWGTLPEAQRAKGAR